MRDETNGGSAARTSSGTHAGAMPRHWSSTSRCSPVRTNRHSTSYDDKLLVSTGALKFSVLQRPNALLCSTNEGADETFHFHFPQGGSASCDRRHRTVHERSATRGRCSRVSVTSNNCGPSLRRAVDPRRDCLPSRGSKTAGEPSEVPRIMPRARSIQSKEEWLVGSLSLVTWVICDT